MKIAWLAAVALAALAFTGAAAAGWAGSRYQKSDCTYNQSTDRLYCVAKFSNEQYTTETFWVADTSCASGLRSSSRTGWLVTTWTGWDLYTGRVPQAKNNIGGNDEGFTETWHDFTDTDLGCAA